MIAASSLVTMESATDTHKGVFIERGMFKLIQNFGCNMLLLQRVQQANFRSWRDSSAGFQTFCLISLVVFSLFGDASFSERIGFLANDSASFSLWEPVVWS